MSRRTTKQNVQKTPFRRKGSKQADATSNMAYYTSLPGQPVPSEQYFDDETGTSQQRANSLQQFPDRQRVMNRPIVRDVHPGYQNLSSAMAPVYVVQQPQLVQQPAGIAYAAPPTQVNVAPAAPVDYRDVPAPRHVRDVERVENVAVKSGSGGKTCMIVSLTLLIVFVLGGIGVGVGLYFKTRDSTSTTTGVTEPITCTNWIASYGRSSAGENTNFLDVLTIIAEKLNISTTDKSQMLHDLFVYAASEDILTNIDTFLTQDFDVEDAAAIYDSLSVIDWNSAHLIDWESLIDEHVTDTDTTSTALEYGGHTVLDILTEVAVRMGIDTSDRVEMLKSLFSNGFSSAFLNSLTQYVLEETPSDLISILNMFDGINWESIQNVDWTTHDTNEEIVAVIDSFSNLATVDHDNFDSHVWFGDLSMLQILTHVAENLYIDTDDRAEMLTNLFLNGFNRRVKRGFREFLSTVSNDEYVETTWYFFRHLDWDPLRNIDWTLVETEADIESTIIQHFNDDWSPGTVSFGEHSLLEILTSISEQLNIATNDQTEMLDQLFSGEPNEDFFTALHKYIEEECEPEEERPILDFFNHLDWTTLQTVDWESHTDLNDLGAIFHSVFDQSDNDDDDDHDGDDDGDDGDDDIWPTWWWKPDPDTTDPTPTIWYPPWLTTTTTKPSTSKSPTASYNTTSVSTTSTATTTVTPVVPICV